MKIAKTLRCIFSALLAISILLAAVPALNVQAQDGPVKQLCVLSTPSFDAFPNIEVSIAALDAGGHAVEGLTNRDFTVQEGGFTYPIDSLQWDENRVGLNLNFVVNLASPTNVPLVKSALLRFGQEYMLEGVDQIAIYTNPSITASKETPYLFLPATTSVTEFTNAVNALPSENKSVSGGQQYIDDAVTEAISNARGESNPCGQFGSVVVLSGPTIFTEYNSAYDAFLQKTISAKVPVYVLQHEGVVDNISEIEGESRRVAESTGGAYYKFLINNASTFTQLDDTFFPAITHDRGGYTLRYRTNQPNSGDHQGVVSLSDGSATTGFSYSVQVLPASITISMPQEGAIIQRTARQQVDSTNIFDSYIQSVEYGLNWPDGYPRDIVSAQLLVNSSTGQATIDLVPESNKFDWEIRDLDQIGDNPITLQIRVIDELGVEALSEPRSIVVQNVLDLDPVRGLSKWAIYGFIALGVLVLALIILVIIMGKQLKDVIKNGGGIKGVFQEVRKTLVGGGRRKALAKLKVIEGPTSSVGKDLTIFTESVKLGRDPAQSDYSFFADTNSSVSGLHCRIERVSGTWRLVAVSKSGSETFLDGQSIPFNQPIPLSNGQIIQMGYPAQQPVIFEFQAIDTGYQPQADDPRKTETDVLRTQVSSGPAPLSFGGPADTPQESGDDLFDQFRDRE